MDEQGSRRCELNILELTLPSAFLLPDRPTDLLLSAPDRSTGLPLDRSTASLPSRPLTERLPSRRTGSRPSSSSSTGTLCPPYLLNVAHPALADHRLLVSISAPPQQQAYGQPPQHQQQQHAGAPLDPRQVESILQQYVPSTI